MKAVNQYIAATPDLLEGAEPYCGPVEVLVNGHWVRATLCYFNRNDGHYRLTVTVDGSRLLVAREEAAEKIRLDTRLQSVHARFTSVRGHPTVSLVDRERAHFEAVNHAIDTGRHELAALRRDTDRHSASVQDREAILRAGIRWMEGYAAERWVK